MRGFRLRRNTSRRWGRWVRDAWGSWRAAGVGQLACVFLNALSARLARCMGAHVAGLCGPVRINGATKDAARGTKSTNVRDTGRDAL